MTMVCGRRVVAMVVMLLASSASAAPCGGTANIHCGDKEDLEIQLWEARPGWPGQPAAAEGSTFTLPPGFTAEVWAKHVPGPRSMAISDTSKATILYMSTFGIFSGRASFMNLSAPALNEVTAIVVQDKAGGETTPKTKIDAHQVVFSSGPHGNSPNGVAVDSNNVLYIAEIKTIYKCVGMDDKVMAAHATGGSVVDKGTHGDYKSYSGPADLTGGGACTVLTDKMPPDWHHGWRYIGISPKTQNLYVQVGAPCNICISPAPYATIAYLKRGADGELDVSNLNSECSGVAAEGTISCTGALGDGALHVVGTGIRNSVGFDWRPEGALAAGVEEEMYFTNNGGDNIAHDKPDDCFYKAVPGADYGYPYCWVDGGGNVARRPVPTASYQRRLDAHACGSTCTLFDDKNYSSAGEYANDDQNPGKGLPESCAKPKDMWQAPVQPLGPHVAALGMRFYTGTAFPTAYQGGNFALVALHGSWNRGNRLGYRVSYVKLDAAGNAVKHGVFMCGFLSNPDGVVHGRPVDIQNLADGSIIVSDDAADRVYRITYTGTGDPAEVEDAPGCDVDIITLNLLETMTDGNLPDFLQTRYHGLTWLIAAVKAVGLEGALAGPGPLTIMAPDDAAFVSAFKALGLPTDPAEALAHPAVKEALPDILKYHAVSGEVMSTDLSDGQEVETLQGEKFTVNIGDKVAIQGGDILPPGVVVAANIKAKNGVIHVIDQVLIPPTISAALKGGGAPAPAADAAAPGPAAAPAPAAPAAAPEQDSVSSATKLAGSFVTAPFLLAGLFQ